MEKKTIGQFIAALRKAAGMTQKDLAERLNVSDKAVSRWERDECAPDLSLIPVIADIFGVTADELLRGERRPISANTQPAGETAETPLSPKSQKQLQYLMRQSLLHYRIQCLISVGIGIVSIIVALIINAFNEAMAGFFVGLAAVIIAAICHIAFTVLAFSKGNADELEEKTAKRYHKTIICTAYGVFCFLLLGFAVFILPLSRVDAPYIGISYQSSDVTNAMWANFFIGTVVCAAAGLILRGVLIKYNIDELSPWARFNRNLLFQTAAVLAGMLAVTILAEVIFYTYAESEWLFVDGMKFEDYATFKEYMETETPLGQDGFVYWTDENDDIDDYDPPVSHDNVEEIRNSKGELLVSYTDKNREVTVIRYDDSEDCLPITVYTDADAVTNRDAISVSEFICTGLCALEIIGAAVIYCKKRQK